MVRTENGNKSTGTDSSEEAPTLKCKQKNQGKKRKRESSEESSNDDELVLPDNAMETERNVHASALKNNLDETSVRKIIKKVVTNDHVLALVQLREEEENSSTDDKKIQPKLTRAKVKELKRVSPRSAAWNLENLELTPIKHIPVKTRPEVKALIAQELPEDEDDEEYEPTHDDVPSDDDHMESCSDLDSQPRTPATPAGSHSNSPRVVKDGPFKVPQEVSTTRRKLEIEEEDATIALRTRSKLSLSATSIEHIESTFVPPDDLPLQDVDEVWNQFLNECLNPASATKHEDDDEADPEYNVAADPDAHDEDEESLGNSLIKISKKELNDLVTELFSILPEAAEEELAGKLANSVLTDTSQTDVSQWEGKQEPISDDENNDKPSKRLKFEKKSPSESETEKRHSINSRRGKEIVNEQSEKENLKTTKAAGKVVEKEPNATPRLTITSKNKTIEISIEERAAPASLRRRIRPAPPETVHIEVDPTVIQMTPEQLLILQQQIRQHVQLAASNFMQTVVHPVHWKMAPTYKEYLTSLMKFVEAKESSVVNVCNLKPALELVTTWEKSVSEDTLENRIMIEFIQSEVDRSRRRTAGNSLYVGEFHETFKKVVSNSPVFLYPYLLPAMPYRPDATRRFCYLHSEDVLIVLGLDQFWRYVESNPTLFKCTKGSHPRVRRGLNVTIELVCKHMLPWVAPRLLAGHVHAARAQGEATNPIWRYFKLNEIPKIEHKLLPFNPSMTLYEQPEEEVPKLWLRFLSKSSKRFRNFIYKRHSVIGRQPDGVTINPGVGLETTIKKPLPIDFTKEIVCYRSTLRPKPISTENNDKFDINIQRLEDNTPQIKENAPTSIDSRKENIELNKLDPTLPTPNFYRLVQTKTGSFLLPLQLKVIGNDQTVNNPVSTTPALVPHNLPRPNTIYNEHCKCCVLLRKINKVKQTYITDYFSRSAVKKCDCSNIKFPKISNRLRLLVRNYMKESELVFKELEKKLVDKRSVETEMQDCDSKDLGYALAYQLKVLTQVSLSRRKFVKKRVSTLLSQFDEDSSDPTTLARELSKSFGAEMADLYLDFLGFLTPEQADKMDAFRDYFTRNCAKDLMEKIEAEVNDKEACHKILNRLKSILSDVQCSSCEVCSALLETMPGHPALARYTFGLFPHRKEARPQPRLTVEPLLRVVEQNDADDTTLGESHNTVDYEADHSSSGEDSDAMSIDVETPPVEENQDAINTTIKMEPPAENEIELSETAISKTEEYESDTTVSVYETENIKLEQDITKWSRDEDKLVLQVLREHLTPEERKQKTFLEVLQEKNVYGLLSESLTHRPLDDIKERVLYILSML